MYEVKKSWTLRVLLVLFTASLFIASLHVFLIFLLSDSLLMTLVILFTNNELSVCLLMTTANILVTTVKLAYYWQLSIYLLMTATTIFCLFLGARWTFREPFTNSSQLDSVDGEKSLVWRTIFLAICRKCISKWY